MQEQAVRVNSAKNKKTMEKKRRVNIFKRLIHYLKPYKKKIMWLIFIILSTSVMNIVPPLLLQYTMDVVIPQNNILGIILMSLALIALGALLGYQTYLQRMVSQFIGHNIVKDIRDQTFTQVNRLSFTFFDKTRTGDIVARIMSDAERLRVFMSNGVVNLVINVFLLTGVLIVMYIWNPIFCLIFACIFPFLFLEIYFYSKKIYPANMETRISNGILATSVQEVMNGIREIKLYGREDYVSNIFKRNNDKYYENIIRSSRYNAYWGPAIPLLLNLSSAFIILFGSLFVIQGNLSLGLLMAAIAYFGLLANPVRSLAGFIRIYNRSKASAERIFELLDRAPLIEDLNGAKDIPISNGLIEFSHVDFGYVSALDDGDKWSQHDTNGDSISNNEEMSALKREKRILTPNNRQNIPHQILHDITFSVNPGEVCAFVGPSGVGKSTLVHLIPRFYDIWNGEIKIDGINIKEYKVKSLRRQIGLVMQNVFLFNGSIADNVIYGIPDNDDIAEETIHKALKLAQLDDFIQSLPNGIHTQIGERGVRLSGGQAQRLSIARVLITNPKILILDEPTANVDAITDQKLIKAIKEVQKGRTTLIIAHRLWTIKNADKIIVLNNGRVDSIGKHEELIQKSEFYKKFFSSQFLDSKKLVSDI